MTGKSHTDPEATPFALDVMKHMNEACNKWKEETNIAFSIYGSPIESTTYKFAKCLQKRFGVIPGITDKSYITNSYHVFVGEEIDAFAKTIITLRIQFCIHDILINKPDYLKHSRNIIFHIRYFHITDCSAC